jgi:hypothetical protein
MSPLEIDYLGEGPSDDIVARKVILAAAAVPGTSYRRPLTGTGKESLDKRLAGLNAGTVFGKPVLVLRDLNNDAVCPAELVEQLLPERNAGMLLRICVRETETWLMADFAAYAHFCGIKASRIPTMPETLRDPKQVILGWAESGQAKDLRRYLADGRRRGVPDWAILGEWHADFANTHWRPERAEQSGRAPSLSRSLARIKAFVASRTAQ